MTQLTTEQIKEQEKQMLLSCVSTLTDNNHFPYVLELMGFDFVPIHALPQFVEVKEDVSDLLYYETICTHKEKDLHLICFIGTSATGGSFGFELTQENWDNHVAQLKAQAQ